MKIVNFDAIFTILETFFQKSGSENPIPKFEIESRKPLTLNPKIDT